MKLSDLYASLSYGLLSNLSAGGEGNGMIPAEYQDRMLLHVNRGLVRIYSKFILSVKEIIIRAYTGNTLYELKSDYADNNPAVVDQKYIADSVEDPFTDDLIKILLVANEDNLEVPLNDSMNENSLFTPTPTSLQIPRAVTGDAYFVVYQARHPTLVADDLDQEISLPVVLEEALERYIAHRVLSAMNGQEHAAKSIEHLQMYETICQMVEDKDLLSTSQIETTTKFEDRGFR